ncbi:MAG: M28 family peptidase [Balneolaceae bacterium]
MRYLVLFLGFFILTQGLAEAQVLPYAKEVVQTLSSDEFQGRGYVNKGDKIASDYIRKEFERFGLKSFSKKYLQKFDLSINTFPKSIELSVNGQKLRAGYDFHVTPGSPSVSGSFSTISLTVEDMLSDQKLRTKLMASMGKFIIVENYKKGDYTKEEQDRLGGVVQFLKYQSSNPASGTIILTNDKLTWNGSQTQHSRPSFTILSDSLDTPITEVKVKLSAKLERSYTTQNVLGYIEGENTDSMIVFIAHYDHFGKMGDAIFPGANDNASGTAMLLSLAKYYSENKPSYNTVFIAFGGEELGLLGSKHFVQNPLFDLTSIKFLVNFDLAGTGDEGIQVVNGSVYRDKFDLLTSINEEMELLPKVKIRGKACNSDHCFFDEAGVPGFYIYTLGGIRAYHDVYDKFETLPFTEFEDYFTLVTEFISRL